MRNERVQTHSDDLAEADNDTGAGRASAGYERESPVDTDWLSGFPV